ncbi:FecR protein [Flaviramulus basaltis]|uniref:FecR protein n=1 Tax=Flaviramulus basaltis TaxID=369401 RepID=A0A1K2IKW3_9FLAO|nr:FecR domain-containing protein [Flaviramulus basaltis]SFZ93093.1 FecR protein [Flaviramulus basaltis]
MEFKLIIKKLNNTLSEEEATIFSEWYNESNLHKNYFNKVKENYHNDSFLIDIEKGWKSIEKQIKPVSVKKTGYLKYAVAASIILLVSITFLFNKNKIEEINNPIIVNSTIEIGTDKATLTLEDGTTIALEQGKHFISDNLESDGEELIYKSPNSNKKVEIAYNYLTIPRGGQYHIKLSDGTEVWLNSESQIKYPITFIQGETRQVELVYGEAYFDVSPSTNHNGSKFKVLTGPQEIEVLGTEFNISAYKDEDAIYTALVEGKVAVVNGNAHTILSPEQQSIINKNISGINVVKADVYSVTSWRKGIFSFDNMPLEKIMKVLSRWYDVDVVFADSEIKDINFNGVLRKNQNIEEILNAIKNVNNIAYVINNNTVVFK